MKIKKEHTIHMSKERTKVQKFKHIGITAKELRYLCNEAVQPTFNKLTFDWDEVTCKNCLKQKNDKDK